MSGALSNTGRWAAKLSKKALTAAKRKGADVADRAMKISAVDRIGKKMDELDFDLIDATSMFFSAIGTPNLKIRRKQRLPEKETVPPKKDRKTSRRKQRRGKGFAAVGADVVRIGIAGSECWSDTESEDDDGDGSDTDTESDEGVDIESVGDSDSERYYDQDSDDDNWVKVKLPGQDKAGRATTNNLEGWFLPSRLRRTQGLALIPRSKLAAIRAKIQAEEAESSSSYASTWSSEEDSDSTGDVVEGRGVAKTTELGESVYHSVILK